MNGNDRFGCNDYSSFGKLQPGQTILQVPCRSPLAVVEALKPYINNRVVCELGCAVGDLTLALAEHAKFVIGIENDPERVSICRQRGIYTILADASAIPPLPIRIDTFYLWINPWVTRSAFDSIAEGTVILAGEMGLWSAESGNPRGVEVMILDDIHREYPGSTLLEVAYDEGPGERQSGTSVLLVVEKRQRLVVRGF